MTKYSAEDAALLKRIRESEYLGAAGLLLSIVIAVINAYYAARGPEVVLQAPEQVLLYRDGEGERAVLSVAMRVVLLNSASAEHGDIMLNASLQPGKSRPRFGFQAVAQPVFTNAANGCDIGARCIVLPGLQIIERVDELVDLPGGGARVRYLSFPLTRVNCEGDREECAAFGTFEEAVAAMTKHPLTYDLKIGFHGDGERKLSCGTTRANGPYLQKIGWVSLACATKGASPSPWL